MSYITLDIIIEIVQMGVLAGIVWRMRTQEPVHNYAETPAPNPNGFFKKAKRKPIAIDDDAAYELEQKHKRGPQP